jgi:hypothetical protein
VCKIMHNHLMAIQNCYIQSWKHINTHLQVIKKNVRPGVVAQAWEAEIRKILGWGQSEQTARPPSQPRADSSMYLSYQLCGRLSLGGSQF